MWKVAGRQVVLQPDLGAADEGTVLRFLHPLSSNHDRDRRLGDKVV